MPRRKYVRISVELFDEVVIALEGYSGLLRSDYATARDPHPEQENNALIRELLQALYPPTKPQTGG